MYVSTSRKPTQRTRVLAHWLERLFGGEYENRGKRSVGEIAARMEEKGFQRAVFIYEKHGNADSLNFFDRDSGWLYPEIVIGEHALLKPQGGRVNPVSTAEAKDAAGRKILELSGFEPAEVDGGLRVVLSEKEICFYDGKNKVFSIKVKGFREAETENEGDHGN